MVVTGVLTGSLGSGQLLSSGSLSLRVQVLNLGLTEDAGERVSGPFSSYPDKARWYIHPGVAVGGAVDIGLVDNEEDL